MFKFELDNKIITFCVGDLVEHWTPEHHWRYWTTIQTCTDAMAALSLDIVHFRVVRAIRTNLGLIKIVIWI